MKSSQEGLGFRDPHETLAPGEHLPVLHSLSQSLAAAPGGLQP